MRIARLLALTTAICCIMPMAGRNALASQSYPGFDRNDYPGDAALDALHATFRYSSYWLNNPPQEQSNSWSGKRALLKQHGFGFLVLFNGREYAQLKGHDAVAMATADGKAAVTAALREGFPKNVLIFLDQEEGGRLLAEQSAYIWAWVNAVRAGGARAGVYCSGIEVPDGAGTISTARDLLMQEPSHRDNKPIAGRMEQLALWVANDQCPPSPGCAITTKTVDDAFSPNSQAGTVGAAAVWQYAQSPRRAQFSSGCPKNDAPDGNCYAPGFPHSAATFLDMNAASSPDPSGGR